MKEHGIEQDDVIMSKGRHTVAPAVLLTIARLSALNVPGVAGLSNLPGGVNRLFKRGIGDGIRLDIQEDLVSADIYVILKDNFNIRDTSRQVQMEVARAITETAGMKVGRINIHIEDIYFIEDSERSAA